MEVPKVLANLKNSLCRLKKTKSVDKSFIVTELFGRKVSIGSQDPDA